MGGPNTVDEIGDIHFVKCGGEVESPKGRIMVWEPGKQKLPLMQHAVGGQLLVISVSERELQWMLEELIEEVF